MKKFKIDLPSILKILGFGPMVRKWLSERALHVPEAQIVDICIAASALPDATGQLVEVTPAQWRAVERAVAKAAGDGLILLTSGGKPTKNLDTTRTSHR